MNEKLSPEIVEALRDTLGNPEWRKQATREIAALMVALLRQEYRLREGEWWLFLLGEPARPLTEKEVEWHQKHGNIPVDGVER